MNLISGWGAEGPNPSSLTYTRTREGTHPRSAREMIEMARVSKMTNLSETMVRQAADWYRQNAVPVAFRKISPLALREVKRLSGGDWRRCEVDDLGRVTIHNNPVWVPSGR